jgi:hypothetical protein
MLGSFTAIRSDVVYRYGGWRSLVCESSYSKRDKLLHKNFDVFADFDSTTLWEKRGAAMPVKETIERAREDAPEGKFPSTTISRSRPAARENEAK